MRNLSRIVLWARIVALAATLAGCVAFAGANDREATAIFDAGGDAGMWAVGLGFAAALLLPGVILLLVSLAIGHRRGSAGIAILGGVALLAPTAWLAASLYPPDRRTDEGSRLDPAQWEQVGDLYLAAFVLVGVAGMLLLASGVAVLARRGADPGVAQ